MWVGWAIGGLGVLLGLFYYVKPRKFKQLEYWHYSLPIVKHYSLDSLEVKYKGQTVQDPTISVMRLVSTGTDPIPAGDFEGNGLTVELRGITEVLSIQLRTVPDSIVPKWAIDGNKVTLEPLLLNREDMVELRMVSDGKPQDICLLARIVGVTSPQLLKTTPVLFSTNHRLVERISIPLVVTVILGGIISIFWTTDTPDFAKIFATIIAFLLLVFIASRTESVYRQSRRWNR